jgi:hypothetical protein
MTPESTFQTLFWVLFGGVLLMRFFFMFRVRRAGQAIMPDKKAVEREGAKGLFAFRLELVPDDRRVGLYTFEYRQTATHQWPERASYGNS